MRQGPGGAEGGPHCGRSSCCLGPPDKLRRTADPLGAGPRVGAEVGVGSAFPAQGVCGRLGVGGAERFPGPYWAPWGWDRACCLADHRHSRPIPVSGRQAEGDIGKIWAARHSERKCRFWADFKNLLCVYYFARLIEESPTYHDGTYLKYTNAVVLKP